MKVTMYELLGMVKDGKELPKLENEVEKDFAYYVYDKWGDTCNLEDLKKILNNEVEILEEKKDNFTGWKMYQDGKEVCSMDYSVEEKKIPEKLTDILRVDDLTPPVDENMHKIWTQTIKNYNKINEIIDYLEELK